MLGVERAANLSLVERDVIGLIAPNLVLGVVLASVMSITFVVQVFGVHR